MPKVRLLSGSFEGEAVNAADNLSMEKAAMLVYEGKFESMDGDVTVTKEHIALLAKNHNEELVKLGDNPLPKDCPPIQLDHSPSAKDTVGRLIGPLVVGEYKGKAALFGRMKILGAENVEKVKDGRWTHLSLGADLEAGKLNELTITPFPAAQNASMLGKFRLMEKNYRDFTYYVEKAKDGTYSAGMQWDSGSGWYDEQANFDSEAKATSYIKKCIDDEWKRNGKIYQGDLDKLSTRMELSQWQRTDSGKKLWVTAVSTKTGKAESWGANKREDGQYDVHREGKVGGQAGTEMEARRILQMIADDNGYRLTGGKVDKEKMKKHLMEKEKLSAEDADKKLASLSQEDSDKLWGDVDAEEKKKLAADSDAESKDADKKDAAELTAARKKEFIKLTKGFRTDAVKMSLDNRKVHLSAKLDGLRLKAKITPAEIKKVDLDKMAKLSEEAVNAVFESYESRQPVILIGQFGDAKAEPVGDMLDAAKNKTMIREMASSMRFSRKMLASAFPTSMDGNKEGAKTVDMSGTSMDKDAQTDMSRVDVHSHLCHMHRLMSEGKHEEAMAHCAKMMAHFEKSPSIADENPTHLSSVAENFKKLENQYETLVKLTTSAMGLTEQDLNEGGE